MNTKPEFVTLSLADLATAVGGIGSGPVNKDEETKVAGGLAYHGTESVRTDQGKRFDMIKEACDRKYTTNGFFGKSVDDAKSGQCFLDQTAPKQ